MASSKKTIMVVVCTVLSQWAVAQTFSEWFRQRKTQIEYYTKQIAGLKVYNDLLLQGYDIVRDGLQIVGDIKNGEFNLHNKYSSSKRTVNAYLVSDRVQTLYDAILKQCGAVNKLSSSLPAYQHQYVSGVSNELQLKAGKAYHDYLELTSDDVYTLGDADRRERIGECMQELENQYAFVLRFRSHAQKMLLQQLKENNDVNSFYNMFQP
jgi:hypothetical protein